MIPSPSSAVPLQVDETYLPEVWAWFAIGVMVIVLRYVVRIRTVGFRGLGVDDCFMVGTLAMWIVDAVIVQITYYTGGNINVTPGTESFLSDRDIAILTLGSKWEYASFYSYSGLIWTLKFSVLFFYRRLKANEWRHTFLTVNRLLYINGVAYLALCLTALFSCWPLQQNWSVNPLPPLHCRFRPQNFWVLVFLNVFTDILILSLPLPILWSLRVSRWRKLAVTLLLCSGLFLIAAAIIRAAFTISGYPSIITINLWGSRETAIGIMAVNAPVLAPLFNDTFWRPGSYRPRKPAAEQWAEQDRIHGVAGGNGRRRQRPTVFEIPSDVVLPKSEPGSLKALDRTDSTVASNHTGHTGDMDLEKGQRGAPAESTGP